RRRTSGALRPRHRGPEVRGRAHDGVGAGRGIPDLGVPRRHRRPVLRRRRAILLGSTLIAGVYGMNFTHMPELDWTFGYPAAIAPMPLRRLGRATWSKGRGGLGPPLPARPPPGRDRDVGTPPPRPPARRPRASRSAASHR